MTHLTNQDLQFIIRRLPKDISRLIKNHNLILAGGFIREMIADQKNVKDIDLFGPSSEALSKAASALKTERGSLTNLHKSDNALTLISLGSLPVQFITRWVFDKPEDCMKSFDFTICQAAIWYNQDFGRWESVCSDKFYSDLAARRLVYTAPQREEEVGGSMLRMVKLVARGYNVQVDSLGMLVARLAKGIRTERVNLQDEEQVGRVLTGLLREVDPMIAMDGFNVLNDDEDFN
jgi:hypothetical protein